MSGVQVAVLPGGPAARVLAQPVASARRERIGVPLCAFAALGLYGVVRWGTLISGGALGRLLGLLALASTLAAAGPVLAGFSRWLAGLVFALATLAGLLIAGFPWDWVVHLRVAVSGRAIGDGLSTLPQITVPYTGINEWVRIVLLLGAMILLLLAGLVLTFLPRRLGLLRRAAAALPLVALSVIPATAVHPRSPYLEGVLLFALVVAFVWGDRVDSRRLGGVLTVCALAAVVGVALAPALDRHRAWINYRRLAASLAPGGVETFNWTQGYGPLHWPHTGRAVLEVQASRPDYWKVEDLDSFNGQGWVSTPVQANIPWQTGVAPSALRRWTQTLQVTMDSMATSKVVVSGSADAPASVPGGAVAGTSPGTWQSAHRLEPGASYRVRAYQPHPSPAQLTSAGSSYPGALARAYLSMAVPELPGLSGSAAASYAGQGFLVPVVFRPFGQRSSIEPGRSVASILAASPYAQAYSLAQRLRAQSSTAYAFVRRVERLLGHGYTYSQTPPSSHYPLEEFLFVHRLGYCQHFAGAMALLLRMGGVPARVAVGFTAGTYDTSTHRWVVSDLDAHAWVEVWFPRYGWVRFDPTPAADPALARSPAGAGPGAGPSARRPSAGHRHELGGAAVRPIRPAARRVRRGSGVWGIVAAPAVLLALLVLGALLTRSRGRQDPVEELIRAFARSGRPLEAAATLSGLERSVSHAPDAAAYLCALRLARFAPAIRRPGPSLRGRRALRRALGTGLGPVGWARAWWALPPRWHWPGTS